MNGHGAKRALMGVLASAFVTAAAAERPIHPATEPSAREPTETPAAAPQDQGSGPNLPTTTLPGRLELHKPNFVMPLTWRADAAGSEDIELEFQISLKYRLFSYPVYFGYTQTSYFRWLDAKNSRPFRETNYNPELWYRFRPGRLWPDWLGLDTGFEHESNGEDVPASRSWNRVYVRPWADYGRWDIALKVWHRLDEDPKEGPDDPTGDDNPRIIDFYGRHELTVGYTWDDGDWAEATTRYAFANDRGAARLRYATPAADGGGYWYLELFSGYGESLETFKENRSRIGIGFALLR